MLEELVSVLECMQYKDGSRLKEAEQYIAQVSILYTIYYKGELHIIYYILMLSLKFYELVKF